MKNCWTPEEITQLKKDYAAGKRLKLIAKELGRTPSAVNKTISRLSITRRSARVFTKKNHLKLPLYKDKQKKSFNRVSSSQKNVTFLTVAKYLQSKGFQISRFSDPIIVNCYRTDEEVFKVGNTTMTKMRVLLFANRLRVEEREPIFSSRDITWY